MIAIIKRFIVLALPLIIIIVVFAFVKIFNQGTFIIHNADNTIISINQENHEIRQNKFEIKLWPGEYTVFIKKTGFEDYAKKINIHRGQKTELTPSFIFIPTFEYIFNKNPYKISDQYKLKNSDGNISYADNQFILADKKNLPKEFTNLPKNIFYILFSPSGNNALIISSDKDLNISELYYYNCKTEELHLISNENFSGINWYQESEKFTYYESIENKGILYSYDTEKLTTTKLTKLTNIDKIKTNTAISDSHIIILPTNGNKDLIDYDINLNRREKITFEGNISDFRVLSDTKKISTINENFEVALLDLVKHERYTLSIKIKDLSKVEYIPRTNKIIYSLTKNGILDEEKYSKTITKELIDTLTEYEEFFYFDLVNWKTEKLFIKSSEIKPIKLFTKLTENNLLYYLSEEGKSYKLKITE